LVKRLEGGGSCKTEHVGERRQGELNASRRVNRLGKFRKGLAPRGRHKERCGKVARSSDAGRNVWKSKKRAGKKNRIENKRRVKSSAPKTVDTKPPNPLKGEELSNCKGGS